MTREDDIIGRYFAPIAGPGGLGLEDDAALLPETPGREQVVTADALVAGVHFFANDPPRSIARKCLGVNLSDLAAKAAEPQGFVLTLALPPGWTDGWLADFTAGLGEAASAGGCPLIGGDTVRTPGPLTVSITALGTVPRGRMTRRTGAGPGDALYVSGTIGDAALGLQLRLAEPSKTPPLGADQRDFLLDRYLHPQPRLGLRGAMRGHASGGMDVSDGFVGDLRKMMRASAVSAQVDLSLLPLSSAARALIAAKPELFATAATGGDDYEILVSVPEVSSGAFEREAALAGVPIARVGVVTPGSDPVTFRAFDGHEALFQRDSFSHF